MQVDADTQQGQMARIWFTRMSADAMPTAAVIMLASTEPGELFPDTAMWEPPYVDEGDISAPPPTIASELIPSVNVGEIEIVLDRTPMTAVGKQLNLQMGQAGDAADSVRWFCLTGFDASGRWALWLESYELNGHNIGGFTMARIDAEQRVDRRCRAMRTLVTNPARLELGMTRAQVRQILGEPSGNGGPDVSLYIHEHPEPGDFVLSHTIAVVFENDRVERFRVSKEESN